MYQQVQRGGGSEARQGVTYSILTPLFLVRKIQP